MSSYKDYKIEELLTINNRSIGKNYPFQRILYLDTGSITKGAIESFQEFSIKAAPSRAKRLVNDSDIIYSTVRPIQRHYGFIRNPQENLVVSTGFAVLTTNTNIADPKYIYYFLTTDEIVNYLDMVAEGSTSAYPSLTPDVIGDIEIQLPDLKIQKSIASILSSLDDKIDLLHRQNKTLEQLIETLFKQAFVDYSYDVKKGILGDLVETTIGGEWGKENPEGDYNFQVQCIRGTDIADLQTGLATRIPTRFVKEKKYNSIEPVEGDLIMEISGGSDDQSTGRTIYINDQVKQFFDSPLVFSNFCRLIRCKKNEYMYYLYCYIQMLYKQGDFFNLENGSSGIRNFDYKAFLFELEYDIHNTAAILKFNSLVQPYFEKINQNKKQIRLLTQYRDMLLPKLLNGEITINK